MTAEPGLMVPYRKAVALSLIATELVTNAFKYAANPAGGGRVEVTVSTSGPGEVQLRSATTAPACPPTGPTPRPAAAGGLASA